MYYEEKMIDGILHYRKEPDGEWLPVSIHDLSEWLIQARDQRDMLHGKIMACIAHANGSESEWGDRAVESFAILQQGIDAL